MSAAPSTKPARVILHVDMDAFYASVEQRDNPSLRGQPVIVGGLGTRGVVATCSYEARKFGVRSAMPMREARQRCPQGRFITPRMSVYKAVSEEVFEILRKFTPLVQGLSLDEAFLDVTASQSLYGDGVKIAQKIKNQIFARTRLTASVGVAHNKLLAKIGSELRKPDGLMHIQPDAVTALLDPMPVNKLFGIGPKTAAALNEIGMMTLQELRLASTDRLIPIVGRDAATLQRRAAGIDDRPVVSEFDEKQISTETTFDVDISNVDQMQKELLELANRTAARLRNKQVAAHGIAVKIRRHDFSTFTRQRRCHPPTNESKVIANLARQLLDEWLLEHPGAAVRLLGVGSYDLGSVVQLSLFDLPAKEVMQSTPLATAPQNKQLDTTLDRIRAKFGNDALVRGSSLQLHP